MVRDLKHKNMTNTIIKFDLIKLEHNKFFVDPTSVFVHGWFNWNLLKEFLFDETYGCLSDIGEGMLVDTNKEIRLEIWEDSDDVRTWIDYKILDIDLD